MILSGSLIKIPYWLCWQIRRMINRLHGVVFYVESTHDYQVMVYILPHIQVPYHLAAENKKVAMALRQKGLHVLTWPVFPTVLIMARHAFHRFPIKAIRKIGLMLDDIMSMISDMSTRISNITELDSAVKRYQEQPDLKREERQRWRRIMFDDISISHGKKAAQIISEFITSISVRSTK
jgi:hypothetical protein